MYCLSINDPLKCLPGEFYCLPELTGDEVRGSVSDSLIAVMNKVSKSHYRITSNKLRTLQADFSGECSPIYTGTTLSFSNLETRAKRVADLISSFRNIKENWDGAGAKAPALKTINNALCFLSLLEEKNISFPACEDVQIMPYGSIVLDVSTTRGVVSIEIGQTKIGYFTDFVKGDNYGSEGVPFSERKMPEDLAQLLS